MFLLNFRKVYDREEVFIVDIKVGKQRDFYKIYYENMFFSKIGVYSKKE